ncbi:hypothetical protein M2370_005339 [Bacillus sp. JUb91]|nr:hypothetical protein [Bacillus sp. JUb91]
MMNGLGEVVLEILLKAIGIGFVIFLIGLGTGWLIWG